MKIIIPLAGPEGEVEKEFKEFKNLIEVYKKPLIKYIADSRPYSLAQAAFILLGETNKKYNIAARLKSILGKGIEIFTLDEITEGAACSVLRYLEQVGVEDDIIIDLADQYLLLDKKFINFMNKHKNMAKGIIPTFNSRYWKWSYVKLNKDGFVCKVREKVNPPLSSDATAGVYYFSNSKEYMRAAKKMIKCNKRVKFNNKFFVSCVYNEFPENCILNYPTKIICPLGSVEGIMAFEQIVW